MPRYLDEAALPDSRVRDMIKNYAPAVERTPQGYLKGVALSAPAAVRPAAAVQGAPGEGEGAQSL